MMAEDDAVDSDKDETSDTNQSHAVKKTKTSQRTLDSDEAEIANAIAGNEGDGEGICFTISYKFIE